MKLTAQRYGKDRVRVLKVLREGATHTVKELEVSVSLEGDFAESYTESDNAKVVPTDTMKNTVNAMAHRHLGAETEPFVKLLAEHFVGKYPQVQRATVRALERVWPRLSIDGTPHSHAFSQSQVARPFAQAVAAKGLVTLESGLEDLLILKSAESGFEDYPRCEFTTLPETKDRILATSLTATWNWSGEPASYALANQSLLAAMMKPFSGNYSPSVQATLFEMATSALESCADISRITLSMPNKHCNLIDLKPLGIENRNELFVPIDEPHGSIEATVARD